MKKGVLKSLTKFIGKLECQTPTQVFSCEFCEIFKTPFLQNTSGGCFLETMFKTLSYNYDGTFSEKGQQLLTTLRKKESLPKRISLDTMEKSTVTCSFFTFTKVVFKGNFRFFGKETFSTYDIMRPKLVEVWY